MAIVKPSEMNFKDKNIILLISGLPGVGKTTLALSAPDVVLVDADNGMARVNPAHRKDASMCETYEELLSDIKSFVGVYKTVVIDTAGALIDLMKDWVIRTEPKASKQSGGISLQGFGFVKEEFKRLSAELRKNFNVVFLFHESIEKNGEDTFYSLVCEGAAKTLVWQPADLGAHLFIQNGERYLGFTPTANYIAKSAYGIKGLVKVPELKEGDKNDFLAKLFAKVRDNLANEQSQVNADLEIYNAAMANGVELIEGIKSAEDVSGVVKAINSLKHGLTSSAELKSLLKVKLSDLGIVWNKENKCYEQAEKSE